MQRPNPTDLDQVLDLTHDEVAFMAGLPARLRASSFEQLMEQAERVAQSMGAAKRTRLETRAILARLGRSAEIQATEAEMVRVEFRLRHWWGALAAELRHRIERPQVH